MRHHPLLSVPPTPSSTVAISLSTGFALNGQKSLENVLAFPNRFRQGRNVFGFIILQKYFMNLHVLDSRFCRFAGMSK